MDANPYQTPDSNLQEGELEFTYAGFWIRLVAMIIDTIIITVVTLPLLLAIYGTDYLFSDQLVAGFWEIIISYVLPPIAVIFFWRYKSATPGKMIFNIHIIDAKTHQKPSFGWCIVRYLGYIVSTLPLLMGYIWIAFDPRKQAFHDKMAGTIVVRMK